MIGETTPIPPPTEAPQALQTPVSKPEAADPAGKESGGRDGPEPTRYGDWEKHGRCIDF